MRTTSERAGITTRRPRPANRVTSTVVTTLTAVLATTAIASPIVAQPTDESAERYAIMPRPSLVEPRAGEFVLTPATVIVVGEETIAAGEQFARSLAPALGYTPSVVYGTGTALSDAAKRLPPFRVAPTRIRLSRTATDDSLGPEGYSLDIGTTDVLVQSAGDAGLFYGLQTLRQLLPPEIFREAPVANVRWTIPAARIVDSPRFAWRGAHLDAGRHFMPVPFVKRWIDLLALHKLNVFHWHLTEDQGWRLEIKRYPKLTSVGSCRDSTLLGPYVSDPAKRRFTGAKHCGFYTQDDVREIVAYAAERHITVVPEIEMPGHAQAAIAAYPELGVYPDSQFGVLQWWGVSDVILNPEPATITFMQNVLEEVLALFPSTFIHIGGDEATKTQWEQSPRVQARMREVGAQDAHELQSWFIRQMDTWLTARGRRLVGWDEILEGGLAPGATVMSWRGMNGGIAAARAGHDVIMAPTSHTYFDYYQSRDRRNEPLAIGGFLPLETVYAFEPVPDSLSATEARHVLGAQAQHWTEYLPTPRHVEYQAFPRLAALSEVVWSAPERRAWPHFRTRLGHHVARLDALAVNYRPLD